MINKPSHNVARSLRLIVAIFGGYAFAAGFVAIIAVALPNFGMVRTESATLGGMLGMLVYLVIIIWAVASTKPIRAAIIIFSTAMIMIGTAPIMVMG